MSLRRTGKEGLYLFHIDTIIGLSIITTETQNEPCSDKERGWRWGACTTLHSPSAQFRKFKNCSGDFYSYHHRHHHHQYQKFSLSSPVKLKTCYESRLALNSCLGLLSIGITVMSSHMQLFTSFSESSLVGSEVWNLQTQRKDYTVFQEWGLANSGKVLERLKFSLKAAQPLIGSRDLFPCQSSWRWQRKLFLKCIRLIKKFTPPPQ